MNAAPNFEDRWLDDLLSTPPEAVPDAGFTARVMTRIRLRRLARPAILGGLGAAGILTAVRFGAAEALGALLPTARITEALEAMPALSTADYTSPVALTMIAAALLVWWVMETA